MKKVVLYSLLLVFGLIGSQLLPGMMGNSYRLFSVIADFFLMIALAYIMIRVGLEFEIDKSRIKSYGWDYIVAMTTAALPWLFVALYFVFLLPGEFFTSWNAWTEILLLSKFSAPTSAGVLFAMLIAAGLGATWVFKKVRILVIFDDLNTIILMIPLQVIMIGLVWQLGAVLIFVISIFIVGWKYLDSIKIPFSWSWLLFYALLITSFSEITYITSKIIYETIPIHFEVLLPAFILGAVISKRKHTAENKYDASFSAIISMIFMFLVGLSMPMIFMGGSNASVVEQATTITAQQPMMPWSMIALHVFVVIIISNLGKMFPLFCYRKEAHWKERLAVSIGMWPRGEIGAGILIISMSHGLGGPFVIIAILSLAFNLLLTGFFIYFVKKLIP